MWQCHGNCYCVYGTMASEGPDKCITYLLCHIIIIMLFTIISCTYPLSVWLYKPRLYCTECGCTDEISPLPRLRRNVAPECYTGVVGRIRNSPLHRRTKQPPKNMSLRGRRQTDAAEPENEERTVTHRPVVLPDPYSGEAEFSEWHDLTFHHSNIPTACLFCMIIR